MSYETKYVKGAHNVICDICAFQMKSTHVRLNWENLLVCEACYEPKHPQLEVRPTKPYEEKIFGPLTGKPTEVEREFGDVDETSDEY